MSLGWFLLVAVLALGGLLVGSCFYFSWWMNRILTGKLQDLDDIRFTGLPPARWRHGGRRRNVYRLNGLVRFARKTNLMESEEIRGQVLEELIKIRGEWVAMPGKEESK